MRLLNIFRKKEVNTETGSFASFFLNATPKEKIKVFTQAAVLADKDQKKLFEEVK